MFKTRPQLLSANELYRLAQTCQPGSGEFCEIMETAVRLYPDAPVANLNAAVARINAAAAKPYLDRAGDSAEARAARKACEEAADEEL